METWEYWNVMLKSEVDSQWEWFQKRRPDPAGSVS